jgi:hypothetical protein
MQHAANRGAGTNTHHAIDMYYSGKSGNAAVSQSQPPTAKTELETYPIPFAPLLLGRTVIRLIRPPFRMRAAGAGGGMGLEG